MNTQNKKIERLCSYLLMLILCTLLIPNTGVAQESVNISGLTVKNSSGSVSISVGQLGYMTMKDHNCSFVSGVQQVYSNWIGLDTPLAKEDYDIYPIPANDHINIQLRNFDTRGARACLFSVNSPPVYLENLKSNRTKIDLRALKAGTYILQVIKNNKVIINTKIVKL